MLSHSSAPGIGQTVQTGEKGRRVMTTSSEQAGGRWARLVRGLGLSLLVVCVVVGAGTAHAQSFMSEAFIDPTDGRFDASDWLLNKRGFLPVPIIVTEPAVGYGGGAALLFFHRTAADKKRQKENPGEPMGLPPSISFGFGFGTESKTWGAGGGHFGTFRDDSFRSLTGGGYFKANIDFYVGDTSFPYSIEGGLISHEFLGRLFGSDFFLGARYRYSQLDPSLPAASSFPPPWDEVFDFETQKNSGLSVVGVFDNRDNIFTPNRGQNVRVYYTFWREAIGGDHDFDVLEASFITYHPLFDERLVLGMNVGADFAFGDAPFYMLPFVKLRGVPSLRYQDDRAGQVEFEVRWRVWERISLIGFGGVGWIGGEKSDLIPSSDPGAIPAGGVGFRYLMARLMGLHTGVDFGFSEDAFAFYIQTGGAW